MSSHNPRATLSSSVTAPRSSMYTLSWCLAAGSSDGADLLATCPVSGGPGTPPVDQPCSTRRRPPRPPRPRRPLDRHDGPVPTERGGHRATFTPLPAIPLGPRDHVWVKQIRCRLRDRAARPLSGGIRHASLCAQPADLPRVSHRLRVFRSTMLTAVSAPELGVLLDGLVARVAAPGPRPPGPPLQPRAALRICRRPSGPPRRHVLPVVVNHSPHLVALRTAAPVRATVPALFLSGRSPFASCPHLASSHRRRLNVVCLSRCPGPDHSITGG